jgi:hypothetical protein
MISVSNQSGHSADVKMDLLFDGCRMRIDQLGPDFIFVESASDHAPCEATIVMRVDSSERRWNVLLPDGISAKSKRVPITLPLSRVA